MIIMATSSVLNSCLLEEYYVSKHATVSYSPELKIVLCTATASYIPMAECEEIFQTAGELIIREKLTKCIYDERKLTAFHQPSMEWLYLVWMERMSKHGLVSHRKLFPDDKQFEHLVNMGRRKILRENPWFSLEKYDIVTCKSLEEAIAV
jgi:hypothetical protein